MAMYSRRNFLANVGTIGAAAGLVASVPRAIAQSIRSADAPAFKSAIELAQMIRDKEISSVELTQYFIDRIERFGATLNAVVVRDFDRALSAARNADDALMRGELAGPLHGLPMTIKESYDIAGLPTTWGIPQFADNIAETDSAVVSRYKAAGAHFMGKINVPLGLGDFQSYNEIYGTTNNPWDTTRVPGGSSGGSAAALAAGLTGLESGSDIGGSIRNPAHFCGVYGHKPTWNVVSPQGHALPGMVTFPDIAVVGPMARSAEDLTLAMDVVVGPDPLNAPGWKLDLPRPTKRKLSEYRIALWPTDACSPVTTEIADRVQAVGDRLAALGATVSDSARPEIDFESSHRTYIYMLNGVVAGGLPEERYQAARKQVAQLDPSDHSLDATMARAIVQDHRDWLQYNTEREHLRTAWRAFFDEWDILICPQMATPAFEHDHRPVKERTIMVDNQPQPYFQQIFWSGVITVAFMPSTVFPTGPSLTGLPLGLQAVGAEYDDLVTIDFTRLLAGEIGGFQPPPAYLDPGHLSG